VLSSARPLRPAPAQMSSLVYHELSTPLATALWYLSRAETLLASAGGEAGARDAVTVAKQQVGRLRDLVDRVLELEKHGRPRLRPTETDLGDVVREVVRAVAAASDAGASIELAIRGPLRGGWDAAAVEQIVHNLLSNALKFGAGRPIEVRVVASEAGAWILVRDHGIGVRPEDQRRIFDRSICAPRSDGGGLGLGLWLVRELTSAHGGRVSVRSRPGQGSTFRVFLQNQAAAKQRPLPHQPPRSLPAHAKPARVALKAVG
jgi:signal transduction histidine kinase